MDQLNDTWLHSDKTENLGKLVQRFEQPLEDSKFIMVSRCAVTPPGQASLGMPWDGVWPAGTIPGICSWAPNTKGDTRNAREAKVTDQWQPRAAAPGKCEMISSKLEAVCFRGKARKGREAPSPPAQQSWHCCAPSPCCASPGCCCCFHRLRSGPQLLSVLVSNPALLIHPCGCASPSPVTVTSALTDWHQQHFGHLSLPSSEFLPRSCLVLHHPAQPYWEECPVPFRSNLWTLSLESLTLPHHTAKSVAGNN